MAATRDLEDIYQEPDLVGANLRIRSADVSNFLNPAMLTLTQPDLLTPNFLISFFYQKKLDHVSY